VSEQAPSRCPQCNGPLRTSELHCPKCDLAIAGDFPRCRFCELPAELLEFLEVFLRCRGVIRQMEAELGISYPTVRSRIDKLLRALGLDADSQGKQSIRDVLERVEQGELSADEAVGRIQAIRGTER
jgi:hypothetical protein